MTETTLLKIGELQQKSRVSIKTIRYYEQIGLIQAVSRTTGNFRLFSPQVLPRLQFIRRSQRLGLSLQEIRELLQIYDSGEPPCTEVRQKFQEKVTEIDDRIAELEQLKQELLASLNRTDAVSREGDRDIICPIIQPPKNSN
ncbi:MAG: heavy metal-responsive transcriptional regulator [Jaaginema sp. PMC 1079.18]|nr:heavy metal-responsive transcriptional regulator [Jaaginema sp. PMC 1080.18]MEC4853961.1 heavy metal-responsive transcriptional regulator [Jaaginema sp. PMC 1079.18]MEC4868877.1 heavy metal-responsive transcriptional regulator [Jaaginema sp. PMC 1078.18]